MIFQRCKLCGVRSDAFGCYETCKAEGPFHEWGDNEVDQPLVTIAGPEYIGQYEMRQDIEIIPADAPGDKKIGWYTQTYMGCEVYKDLDTKQSLLNYNDIQPGDVIYAAFITGGYAKVTVKDKKFAETEGNLYILDFDIDDRHCWTCGGIINKKVLSFNIELK